MLCVKRWQQDIDIYFPLESWDWDRSKWLFVFQEKIEHGRIFSSTPVSLSDTKLPLLIVCYECITVNIILLENRVYPEVKGQKMKRRIKKIKSVWWQNSESQH